MKIKYIFTYPFCMPLGGGGQVIEIIVDKLSQNYNIEVFDPLKKDIDFDILLYFGCTYISPEILRYFRSKGVKIILFPIYDRPKPFWQLNLVKILKNIPILNIYSLREQIFDNVDAIITHSTFELRDVVKLFNADISKCKVFHYGIKDDFFIKSKNISEELFINKYGIKDFVFFGAASVNSRKNQLNLIKALKDTNIKIVINNTHNVEESIRDQFWSEVKASKNILCLKELDQDMLISCYKAAHTAVSLSNSETAGLVNLEAAYLDCNLVVSNLEAHKEYLQDYPVAYVNQNNLSEIKEAVEKSLKTKYNPEVKNFIEKEYTWNNYINQLRLIINDLN